MSDDRERAALRFAGVKRIADFCELGVRRAGVDGMAVMWADPFDSLESVFTTDSVAQHLAELEFTLGEGPGLASLVTKRVVGCDDLAAARAGERWPAFAPDVVVESDKVFTAYTDEELVAKNCAIVSPPVVTPPVTAVSPPTAVVSPPTVNLPDTGASWTLTVFALLGALCVAAGAATIRASVKTR